MAHAFRGRAVVALLAVVPMVVGLTACSNDDPKDPGSTTSSAQGSGSGKKLPFVDPGSDASGGGTTGGGGSTDGGGSTGGGGTSGGGTTGGGSSTGDIVKFGDTDLSAINWDVYCSTSSSYVVTGSDGSAEDPLASEVTLLVTADETGKVDSVMIFDEDDDYVMYSSETNGGNVTLTVENGRARTSGAGDTFGITDPVPFEIDVACDSEF